MLLQMERFHSFFMVVYMCVCEHVSHFFIHSSVDGCLGCFHVLAIINGAVMNTGVYVSFQIRVFIFSRYMPRGGIGGSYGDSIFSFFLKELTYCFP